MLIERASAYERKVVDVVWEHGRAVVATWNTFEVCDQNSSFGLNLSLFGKRAGLFVSLHILRKFLLELQTCLLKSQRV